MSDFQPLWIYFCSSGEPAEDEGRSSSKVSCYCSDLEESSEEVNVVKNELSQLRMSFNAELSQWQLKVKAKEEQLRSANEYLETFSLERENDRLEITKLTQELCKERRLRDTGNSMMDDFRDQVGHTQCLKITYNGLILIFRHEN